jgi:hypothetical protein
VDNNSKQMLVQDKNVYQDTLDMLQCVEDELVQAQGAANQAMNAYKNAFSFDPGIHRELTMLQLALSHAWGANRAGIVKIETSMVMTAKEVA